MVAFAPPQQIQRQDLGQVRARRSPPEERRDVRTLHHLLFVVRDQYLFKGKTTTCIALMSFQGNDFISSAVTPQL